MHFELLQYTLFFYMVGIYSLVVVSSRLCTSNINRLKYAKDTGKMLYSALGILYRLCSSLRFLKLIVTFATCYPDIVTMESSTALPTIYTSPPAYVVTCYLQSGCTTPPSYLGNAHVCMKVDIMQVHA